MAAVDARPRGVVQRGVADDSPGRVEPRPGREDVDVPGSQVCFEKWRASIERLRLIGTHDPSLEGPEGAGDCQQSKESNRG